MSRMFHASEGSSRPRQGILALIMLAILLGSVGAAAWMVRLRSVPADHAVSLLQQVRQEGLGKYWSGEQVSWRLWESRERRVIGWGFEGRRPTGAGFAGVSYVSRADDRWEEQWELQTDAKGGRYSSGLLDPDHGLGITCVIALSKNRVGVEWTLLTDRGANSEHASAAAPDNYIPEGMMALMAQVVASQDRPAKFMTILNHEAVLDGQIRFAPVTMTPQGRWRVLVECSALTRRTRDLYHLNDKGEVALVQGLDAGVSERLVSLAEVLRVEPQALDVLVRKFPKDEQVRRIYEEGKAPRPRGRGGLIPRIWQPGLTGGRARGSSSPSPLPA